MTFRPLFSGKNRRARTPIGRKPVLEILEDRTVPTITFGGTIPNVSSGNTLPTITVNTDSPAPVTLSLNQANAAGTPLLGGTVTVTPSGNVAQFTGLVIYGGSGKDFSLTAKSGSELVTSNLFLVKQGGDHLYVTAVDTAGPIGLGGPIPIPTTTATAALPDIQVRVLDAGGSLDASNGAGSAPGTMVQLYLAESPDGASFVNASGAPVAAPVAEVKDGIATFSGVRLNKAAPGYVLGAQAVGNTLLRQGTSNRFTIIAGQAEKIEFLIQPAYAGRNDLLNSYNPNHFGSWTGVVLVATDKVGNRTTAGLTADDEITIDAFNGNTAAPLVPGQNKIQFDTTTGIVAFTRLQMSNPTPANDSPNYTLVATGKIGGVSTAAVTSTTFGIGEPRVGNGIRFGSAIPFPLAAHVETLFDLDVELTDASGNVLVNNNTDRVVITTGLVSGNKSVVVQNGVAHFKDIYFAAQSKLDGGGTKIAIAASYEDSGFGTVTGPLTTMLAGPRAALAFDNGGLIGTPVDPQDPKKGTIVTAGTYLTMDAPGAPPSLRVRLVDANGNTVTDDPDPTPVVVSLGILRNEGRGPVFLGQGNSPTNTTYPAHQSDPGLHPYAVATVDKHTGIATFDNVYMTYVGKDFLISAGTSAFAVSSASTALPIELVPNKAFKLVFINQPTGPGPSENNVTADVSFPVTGAGPFNNQPGLAVAFEDEVGNIAKHFPGTVNIELVPTATGPGTLGGLTSVPTYLGVSLFNNLYVSQESVTPSPLYTLQATGTNEFGHSVSASSEEFAVNPPFGDFTYQGHAIQPVLTFVTSPPPTLNEGDNFTVQLQVSDPTYPGTLPADFFVNNLPAHVTIILRDVDGNPIPSGGPQFTGDPFSSILVGVNGLISFTENVINVTGNATFQLYAYLDLLGGSITKDTTPKAPSFLVTGSAGLQNGIFMGPLVPQGIGSQSAAGGPPDVVAVGQGSMITNFDIYDSLPINQAEDFGKRSWYPSFSYTPKTLTAPPPMQQPVVAAGFNQVPQTSDYWSAMIFPQNLGGAGLPTDSAGNEIWAIYADPIAALVNSNEAGKPDFAGLGIGTPTNMFVTQDQEFTDLTDVLPPGQPFSLHNPQYPGALDIDYRYNSSADPRGFEDFSVGLQGVKGDGRVLRYSDWTVTIDWDGKLQATMGTGLPSVYFTAPNLNGGPLQLVTRAKRDAQSNQLDADVTIITYDGNGQEINAGSGEHTGPLMIEIRYALHDIHDQPPPGSTDPWALRTINNFYGLYLPAGATWSLDSNTNGTITFHLPDQISRPATLNNTNQITVADTTDLVVGMGVSGAAGAGIPAGTVITAINGTTITLSAKTKSGPFTLVFDQNFFSVATLPANVTRHAATTLNSTVLAVDDATGLATGMTATGFGIAPGTTITVTGSTVTLSQNATATATGNIQFTLLSTMSDTYNDFRKHAYTFATGSTSSFSYNQAFDPVTKKAGGLTTTLLLQTQVRQTGGDLIDNSPMQALYLHQTLNLSPTDQPALTNYTYLSPRGTMTALSGAVFHTQLTYEGSLPEMVPLPNTIKPGTDPQDAHPDAFLWQTFLLPLLRSISTISTFEGQFTLDLLFPNTNNYFEGQSMYGVMQLVPILLEIANSLDSQLTAQDKARAARFAEQIFNQVKDRMSAWLSATDDQAMKMLYYQPATLEEKNAPANRQGWQSLMSLLAGFHSSESLNDHHLIGGYFMKTAALIAQYDSLWGASPSMVGSKTLAGRMGEVVGLLVSDISNYDRSSKDFPFLRNFNVYAGHSWASGNANFTVGTNQESSSEALNYASGLIMWGEATGDQALRDLGIYLYTTELDAVRTYYFNIKGTDAFPPEYTNNAGEVRRRLFTFLTGSSSTYKGFVGGATTNVAGIQILPIGGGAYYHGSDFEFVNEVAKLALSPEGDFAEGDVPVAPPLYTAILIPYSALGDADKALDEYLAKLPSIGSLNSGDLFDTHSIGIYFMQGLRAYGHVDTTVTADTTSYVVFVNPANNVRTYVAYNPSPAPITVHFYDNTGGVLLNMTVAGRSTMAAHADAGKNAVPVAQRTTPDYSFETPLNRFFFDTAANGQPTMVHGQTGGEGGTGTKIGSDGRDVAPLIVPNSSPIDAKATASPITFTITGLTGAYTGETEQVLYSLWLDPQYQAITPSISVQIIYDRKGDGADVTVHNYDPYNAASLTPGYAQASSFFGGGINGGSEKGGISPYGYPPDLVNGTITIKIGDNNATGLGTRLRTDASGAQGRISFIDFPYAFTKIGGKLVSEADPSGVEELAPPAESLNEESFVAAAAEAPHADLAYTTEVIYSDPAKKIGTVIFTTAALGNQTLEITADEATGLLKNNRFAAGDPNFTSPFDFGGGQTIANDPLTKILIGNANGDSIVLGTPGSPASSMLANFKLSNTGVTGSLTIDDTGRAASAIYTVQQFEILSRVNDQIAGSTPGRLLNVDLQGGTFQGDIFLKTGTNQDIVNVDGTRLNEVVVLDSAGGNEDVFLGDGSMQNILGQVNVTNSSAGFTDLTLINDVALNASTTVTISESQVTGLAPAPILFLDSSIDDLAILGGVNPSVYEITGGLGGSHFSLILFNEGNIVRVGDNGLVDFTWQSMAIQGGGSGNRLEFDDSAHAADTTVTIGDQYVSGLGGLPEVQYGGFTSVQVALGTAANGLVVQNSINGPTHIDVLSVGPLTILDVDTEGASLTVKTSDVVVVGPTASAATAISTGGGDLLIIANNRTSQVTVQQTIDTTGGADIGQFEIGPNVSPPTGDPPYHAALPAFGDLLINAAVGALAVASGDFQTASVTAAYSQPLKVSLKDADGNPVPAGFPVTFTAPATGASGTFTGGTNTITVFTDAGGFASASFTANTVAGGVIINVTAPAAYGSAQFGLLNLALAPTQIVTVAGTPQTTQVGNIFPIRLMARVTDAFGNPVVGVNVLYSAPESGPSGTFQDDLPFRNTLTGFDGLAKPFDLLANSITGSFTVTAVVDGVPTPAVFDLTNTAGSPATIVPNGGTTPQTGLVNKAFARPLQVLVKDADGNAVSGVSVRFVAPASGASGTFAGGLTSMTATTNANGIATSSVFTANGVSGAYTVTANTDPSVAVFAGFALTNLTADQRFVNALYVDYLGRPGAIAELDAWVAAMPAIGQAGVAHGIIRSIEALTRVVDSMYVKLLNRSPGGGEQAGWVNALSGSATEEQVIAGIVGSAEFAARAQALFPGVSSDTAYVSALFSLLLNRPADPGGLAGWVAALPSLGRAGVALAFTGSAEFRSGAVRTFYGDPTQSPRPYQPFFVDLLHRGAPPTAGEVQGWVNSTLDVLKIQLAFASSPEFYSNG